MSLLLDVAGLPRSTYYYYTKKQKEPNKYAELREEICAIVTENKGRYGYRRVTQELKNRGFFYPTVEFVEPFASWLTTYANAWGDWLNSPLSWNDSYYKMVAADPDFGIDKGWYEDGSNWHSFNDFFSRRLASPDVRPIDDVAEVVAPVDSWPKATYEIDDDNQLVYPDDVNIKTAMFSDMADLIGHDSRYKDAFAGGTLTHTFLDVNDYHHYHSPVEGKLVELRTIPGVAAGGGYTLWDNEAKRY